MAGNVKEWCWNEAAGGKRYILEGAFTDPTYMFRDPDAQLAFDRRPGFGFRSMRQPTALDATLTSPIATMKPDLAALKPVGNEVYEAYRHLYDYDPIPLDTRVEETDANDPHWRKERVTVQAAYGGERLPMYVFVPRAYPPPYQAVVYFSWLRRRHAALEPRVVAADGGVPGEERGAWSSIRSTSRRSSGAWTDSRARGSCVRSASSGDRMSGGWSTIWSRGRMSTRSAWRSTG
jgi:hypothetical protein